MLKRLPFVKLETKLVFLGIFLVLLGFVPFWILGQGSVVIAHDQLDGELFAYLLHGKYLGTGVEIFPEWMGGVAKTALTPPAVLPILWYQFLPPLQAFLWNQWIVAVTAFVGMFYFLKKVGRQMESALVHNFSSKNWMFFLIALCFSYLPFYSTYGLCVAGIPLLVYAIWELAEGKHRVWNMVWVLYYGAMSSFVLIGYAVVGMLCLYSIALLRKRKKAVWVYAATLGLTGYYIGTNMDLVLQVLGKGGAGVSHKTELVLAELPFWKTSVDLWLEGSGHAASYHKWMIVPLLVMLFYYGVKFPKLSSAIKKQFILLCSLFGTTIAIALFYGFYHWAPIVKLRNEMGGLAVYFQVDRIYWFYPFLWYTMLAVMILILLESTMENDKKRRFLTSSLIAGCLLFVTGVVLWNSDFKKNIRQIMNPNTSNAITWEKYFGEPIFEEIRDYIGKEQSTYRVGSIGLHPAVAVYNGFYTIDGYSNNYDLSYKQKFRQIIEGELDKSQELKTYFDNWGNRCYLFSSELGKQYYIDKDAGVTIKDLAFDTEQLKAMECEYLFSAVKIENATALGFIQEGFFETDPLGSYGIFLYSVH